MIGLIARRFGLRGRTRSRGALVRGRPGGGCRLAPERLEDRRMLSGVTMITHGHFGNAAPGGWVHEMAAAMAERAVAAGMSEVAQYMMVVEEGANDTIVVHPPDRYAGPASWEEAVVKVDWSDLSVGLFTSTPTGDVADAITDYLADNQVDGRWLWESPVQLIGHSRGASLNTVLAERLGELGVWVDHLTALDPHPVDGIGGDDPVDFGDAPMNIWQNVRFADDFWREDLDPSDFDGEAVEGAHNVQLDEGLLAQGGYSWEHFDVHLWYHGTVDTGPDANDGDKDVPADWYGGTHPARDESGYYFSRVVGGVRPGCGLATGGAHREPVTLSVSGPDVWDNVEIAGLLDDLPVPQGDPIELPVGFEDLNQDATVTVGYDTDANPYNGTVEANRQSQSTAGYVDVIPFALATAEMPLGQYHVYAEIGNGTHTRYYYAPGEVTVQGGSISGTVFEDLDEDGFKDDGEPGLKGWTVELSRMGLPVTSTVTNDDGDYSFTELEAGSYVVAEVVRPGWEPTSSGGQQAAAPLSTEHAWQPGSQVSDDLDGSAEILAPVGAAVSADDVPSHWTMIPNYRDVPDFAWYYGCSPTVAGMLFAWWDAQPGTGDLFDGDASTWWGDSSESPSGGTKAMVAATAHIVAGQENGYDYGDWHNSPSYPEHVANPTSLADFIKTVNSLTYRRDLAPGLDGFAEWDAPWTPMDESYHAEATTYNTSYGWSFEDFCEEIDRGFPVHLGLQGHSVLALGYWDLSTPEDPNNYGYVAYTSWPGWGLVEWRWDGEGVPDERAVYAATYLRVTPESAPGVRVVDLEPGQIVEEVDFGNRELPAEVKQEHVFYNSSAFDGNDPAANEQDDQAIATDKHSLSDGQTAGFANYTSYSRGINGLMVDVEYLADADGLTLENLDQYFQLRAGNSDDPGLWADAPEPSGVTVRETPGVENSHRVTITWADYAIRNAWLEVTVQANEDYTGLDAPEVFYFGNAVGESGNSDADAEVDDIDVLLARSNPHNFFNPAGVTDAYDYNRDASVNATDMLIARSNPTDPETALRLLDLSQGEGTADWLVAASQMGGRKAQIDGAGAPPRFATATPHVADLAWLCDLQQTGTKGRPAAKQPPAAPVVDMLLTAYGQ